MTEQQSHPVPAGWCYRCAGVWHDRHALGTDPGLDKLCQHYQGPLTEDNYAAVLLGIAAAGASDRMGREVSVGELEDAAAVLVRVDRHRRRQR